MSGDDIPYQLRPNKFIDRQMFMDLLARIVIPVGPDKYAYISMGGRHLRDHYSVYKQLGITSLIAFDIDENIVLRQRANAPIDRAVCETMPASDVPSRLDSLPSIFPDVSNVIVWLDYTDPNQRLSQFQEMVQVAERLQPGDVLRITFNASNQNLDGERGRAVWKEEGYDSPGTFRLKRLRDQLGQFVPANLEVIEDTDLPSVLCQCVGLALAASEANNTASLLRPVLLTSYQDGQRMVTATCVATNKAGELPREGQLQAWGFLPGGWADVVEIEAPDLSLKEKLTIDSLISSPPQEISTALGFLLAANADRSNKAIASYQKLHRFYPSFHNIER